MELPPLLLLGLALAVAPTVAQHVFDCPVDWLQYAGHCYKFVSFPELSYENARSHCDGHGAALLSVEDQAEHSFVSETLQRLDPQLHDWYTSGATERRDQRSRVLLWKGTGQEIRFDQQFWLPGHTNLSEGIIVYKYGVVGYGWSMAGGGEQLPFVCEISQAEAYRIVAEDRDFDYGLHEPDPNSLPRGPHFLLQPHSVVVVGQASQAVLECAVLANPLPTYRWLRGDNLDEEVTAQVDPRYTLTNGRLTIQNPLPLKDGGQYRCVAHNRFGSVLSNPVQLSFGSLGEFSNVPDSAVRANSYDGVAVQCSRIEYRPAIRYQWMRGNTQRFIRPEMQPYIFMSQNGKLYFSEVTRADEGDYRCMVILSGLDRFSIGTSQPPTRTSMPIPLLVRDQAPKADWGPEIHNDFIAVFPQPPLRGHNVRLECFAFGTSNEPFKYSWRRELRPLPERARLLDHNRVLVLRDAQLEDQGVYTCTVTRSSEAKDSKSITLNLGAKPYFIVPLKSQHLDKGAQLTWRCEARARPLPQYTWYKDGQVLSGDVDGVSVQSNILTIRQLGEEHQGMYQCAAQNSHGLTLTTAQLRVLSFAPYFDKSPLPSTVSGSVNGNISLLCRPEGAPRPEITWLRNGSPIASDGRHYTVLPNGYLHVTGLQLSDQGTFSCQASNLHGEARSSTSLSVSRGTAIFRAPVHSRVVMNGTAFLACEASHDPDLDLVYLWRFNGRVLHTQGNPHFAQEVGPGRAGLYILTAQFWHAGTYSCSAKTTLDQDSRSAVLTVVGPPAEPAGLFVEATTVQEHSAVLRWSAASGRGSPVLHYELQLSSAYDPSWRTVIAHLPERDTLVQSNELYEEKRRYLVEGLSPNVDYRFRLMAANEFGMGPPSLPSPYVHTPSAPPTKAPSNVRGGGGSVGELTIQWEPLALEDRSGSGTKYIVYWRRQSDNNDGLWRQGEAGAEDEQYVHLVGAENYFLEYEVKVQAVNDLGPGPNSTIAVIYSAEDLPVVAPQNVESDGYNGTALEVSWDEVPEGRQTTRGFIRGFQVNYWPEDEPDYVRFIRYEGNVQSGVVIGLYTEYNHYVDCQVYNSAGLGPRSEEFVNETPKAPPGDYPEEVRVYSNGADSVRVWWRGIGVTMEEEIIAGYKLYYWPASEDYRSAMVLETGARTEREAVLEGLEKGVIYALRVAGYNSGGDGKKSPVKYFTLGGQVRINPTLATTIDVFMAGAERPLLAPCLVAVASLATLLPSLLQ